MARDTTVQFRMDASIKEEAFAVFREMGISPSEAVRVFFQQVQKTRTLPFKVAPDDETLVQGDLEQGYQDWLRFRLAQTVKALDRGDMPSFPTEAAKALLQERLAARRTTQAKPAG
jgi:addiction module RelB/DinJ family antitoxin